MCLAGVNGKNSCDKEVGQKRGVMEGCTAGTLSGKPVLETHTNAEIRGLDADPRK